MRANIKGEYWLLPCGQLEDSDGHGMDPDHVTHVISAMERLVLEAFSKTPEECEHTDLHAFMASEEARYLSHGKDPWEEAIQSIQESQEPWMNPTTAEEICGILRSKDFNGVEDPRDFAIRVWKWIRIEREHLALPDYQKSTLKRAGEAMLNILYQEAENPDEFCEESARNLEVEVHRYSDKDGQTVTLETLLGGRMPEGGGSSSFQENLRRAGRRDLDLRDQELVPGFYPGTAQ